MKKFINTILVLMLVFTFPFVTYALDDVETESANLDNTSEQTNKEINEPTTNEQTTDLIEKETISEKNGEIIDKEITENSNDETITTNELTRNTTDEVEEKTEENENNITKDTNDNSNIETNGSRWTAEQPERLLTSNKIIDSHNVEYEAQWYYFEGKVTLTITIPEDYEEDKIVIAPDVFEKLAFKVYGDLYEYETENMIFGAVFQAGDKMDLDIIINNLSKYTYNYDKTSFEIFPKEDIVYIEVDENVQDEKAPLFNGNTVNDKYHFSRMYNTALRELIPNSSQLKITDDAIDSALKTKGYENGIADYSKYLLDFYNNKYGTNYSNLDNFPDGVIREILGETDPYLHLNSAYSSVGINYIQTTGRWPDTPESILNQINNKTGKNYNTIEEFVVEYYNGVYETNATKLVDLSAEALDEFFSSQGMERGGEYLLETDPEVLALSYNYFYNKALGFVFEEDKENKTWYDLYNESENYSIGEYMRDKSKGDDQIISAAGSLAPNSTNSIKNTTLFTSGNYVLNAYINYEFMVDLQLSYSALKGNVIAKYVDIDTLEEIESREETSGMVGKDYNTFKKDIDDYEYVKVEGEESGTYIDGTIYVTYYYKRIIVGNVIAKYVDIDTLEEIESREETSGIVGKDYNTFKKDIDDYEYVTVEGEESGTYIDGTIYVTYYYTKNTGDEGEPEKEPNKDDDIITPPHTDEVSSFNINIDNYVLYLDDRKYRKIVVK